jgi:hypothetical protein
MLAPGHCEEALRRFFRKQRVGQLTDLFQVLHTTSRMSVFRRLKSLGYLSSFTHAGRYYTLAEVPQFDQWGLWFHRQVGFSRAGTLKSTIVELVNGSATGMTPKELRELLKLSASNTVYNTLRELVYSRQLSQQKVDGSSIYLGADPRSAAQQVTARRELAAALKEMLRVATDEEVVEVLVEALRAAPEIPEPDIVAGRLVARGIRLEPHHVVQVYEEHRLVPGKKTAGPSSRPSRS